MPADDRDAKFERALARELRAGSGQTGCPDAETLAAYHDRSLSLEEMAHWKQHISGCAMCQEALSLVEVTEKQVAADWEKQEVPVLEAAGLPKLVPQSRVTMSMGGAEESRKSAAPVTMVQPRRPKLIRWAIPLGAVAAGNSGVDWNSRAANDEITGSGERAGGGKSAASSAGTE